MSWTRDSRMKAKAGVPETEKACVFEKLIKIQEAIDEIFFAARHKVIVMLKTEDGIPSKKKAADSIIV